MWRGIILPLLGVFQDFSAGVSKILSTDLKTLIAFSFLSEILFKFTMGFPDSSVGKESAYNTGDPGSIPGSGRSHGEGVGYPLQYSWNSFVAQLVKTLPATRDTWVRSLGWKDPLEKGKATHSSILAWRIPWLYSPWGGKESDTTERLSLCTLYSVLRTQKRVM